MKRVLFICAGFALLFTSCDPDMLPYNTDPRDGKRLYNKSAYTNSKGQIRYKTNPSKDDGSKRVQCGGYVYPWYGKHESVSRGRKNHSMPWRDQANGN